MYITKEQLEFLEKEFGIKESDIEKMDIDQWQDVRMKCFGIEEVEAYKTFVDDKEFPLSERGELAVSLADLKYRTLMGK